ncbi:MAG: TIGR02281 family clan AA aspartic protease [Rickettsiaceae bacterium]|nr:TIGR02281 family clan AA aspartic protease [Rickettsiaceae bacterium]
MISGDILNFVFMLIILAFLLISYFKSGIGFNHFKLIAVWISLFIILIAVYAFRFEIVDVKNRILAVLVPSYSWSQKPGEITIARHANGHFYLSAYSEDNQKVTFLVDTGATNLALTMKDAITLGVDTRYLRYTQRYSTANGENYGAPVTIRQMKIGDKIFYNVRAHILATGLDTSLLGMSILDDFKDFQINRDLLTLRY